MPGEIQGFVITSECCVGNHLIRSYFWLHGGIWVQITGRLVPAPGRKQSFCESFGATSGCPTLGTALPRRSGAAEPRLSNIKESELHKRKGRTRSKGGCCRGIKAALFKSHGENVIAGCALPCAILVKRREKGQMV